MLPQMVLFHSFLWLSSILLCMYANLLYSFVNRHLGYFYALALCMEHWGARVFSN